MAGIIRKYAIIEIGILLVVAFYAMFPPSLVLKVWVYASFSFSRMLAAYILSLIFSILYGLYAATNKKAERIMIPILDILQSIPILGFFPIAIYLLIIYLPTAVGVELASIILIFTSQAWNMAFGVYESILTIPNDIKDAANVFKLKGMRRFRILYYPAMIPRLVYNSMMSWAGGWYFLFAAEIISVGNTSYKIPGLGSFMWEMVESGKLEYGLLALATLIVIIVAMDILIWRPLSKASEKYKYESLSEEQITKKFYLAKILDYMPSMDFMFKFFRFRMNRSLKGRHFRFFVKLWRNKRYLGYAALILIFGFIGYALGVSLRKGIYINVPISAIYPVPLAILLSIARLAIAYALSLLWIIPVVIYIKFHRRAEKILNPIFEIAASIPATALFPFFVLILIKTPFGINLASILLIMTGMQWYILFNALSGISSFPADYDAVSKAFKFSKWQYIKKVLLPGIYPPIITGSITGWGGGWNALIVSEYLFINGVTYSVLGIGYLIDYATYVQGNVMLNIIYVIFMALTVVVLNRLLWRKLYARSQRYAYET
ncbi:MAG: ABC transporter permease subunit [Thermoplasmata archaeon]|nr:ABC transporter permease subunit [Thermoplasmata archaeon]